MNPIDRELRDEFLRLRAFRVGDYVLSSGQRSSYYVDGKLVTLHPRGARLVGDAILDRILPYNVEAIGGPAVGAIPMAVAVSLRALERGMSLPAFFVRQQAKQHGLEKWIEGLPEDHAIKRVAMVDDVITSGGSVLRAVDRAREGGLEVAVVAGIVDRQAGAAEEIAGYNIPYEFLFTPEQLTVGKESSPV